MDGFAEFEAALRSALAHLYDPTYQPSELLCALIGCEEEPKAGLVQAALIQCIEQSRPEPGTPIGARNQRIYRLLSCRYLEQLTQEQTAQRLNITARHLRREQQAAVQALAQQLWRQFGLENWPKSEGDATVSASPERLVPGLRSTAWRSQLKQELASLHQSDPDTVASVATTIDSTVKLAQTLTTKHAIELRLRVMEDDLTANIHPSALRQVLLMAVNMVMEHMSSVRISLDTRRNNPNIRFLLVGEPVVVEQAPKSDLMQEILMAHGGSVHVLREEERLTVQIEVPSADVVRVLVIDDNVDLIHFYQRYTTKTRYQIIPIPEGERLLERIVEGEPDIIVLDIMLPGTDGWDLLTQLHEHPDTRSVPIIVCSVVRHEELAFELGAASYLPKPVRRQEFIQALDQVLYQGEPE